MMAEVDEEGVPAEEQQPPLSAPPGGAEQSQPAPRLEEPDERPAEQGQPAARTQEAEDHPAEQSQPDARTEEAEDHPAEQSQPAVRLMEPSEQPAGDAQPAVWTEKPTEGSAMGVEDTYQYGAYSVDSPLVQFKLKRFFVLRPGTLNQAMQDIQALVDKEVDGSVLSLWLMAEVDHWNNEKERLVILTENSMLVFKYDFVMFNCEQIQRIPLNFVDRICHGPFSFPKRSLLQRDGEGVRVFWDRLREPSFTSRWNPFASDFPFITFTHHPVRKISHTFSALCDINTFREQLKDAAQKAHAKKPVPGKANGVLVLNQSLLTEAYVGIMSFLGNQNKLGYCMARGNFGF